MKKIQTNNPIEAIAKDRVVRQTVARKSHLLFFHLYFSHYVKYPIAEFQKDIFRITEDSSNRLACIVAFRGSAKSTIVTLSYSLWAILGIQQRKFVVIICQTQAQARQHMVNIRRELENNRLLKSDMGPFQEETGGEWAMSSLVFTNTNARIMVASVEQSIRGIRHFEHRPDLLILDDVEDMNSCKTMEGRDKTFNWFTREVMPLGDLSTRVILVGNLLHEDSLMMRMKARIDAGEVKGIYRWFPLLDTNGACLWPGKFDDDEKIEALRQSVADPRAWMQEYLLRIVSNTEQVIYREWIRYYDELPTFKSGATLRCILSGVDLAISDKTYADYTAIVTMAVYEIDRKLLFYVMPNPVNERLTFPQTIDRIRFLYETLHQGNRYNKFLVEDVAYQKSVIQQLEVFYVPVEGVSVGGADKRSRLTLTGPHVESGKILFPKKGCEHLITQLVGFAQERHDDLADAFSLVANKATAMRPPGLSLGECNSRASKMITSGFRTKQF